MLTYEEKVRLVNRICFYLFAIGTALILFGGGIELLHRFGWWRECPFF